MKNLQHYIDNRNQWNSFFPNSKQITFPLDQKTVNDLARSLDSDLSPENLHCDGEASPSQARRKYAQLQGVLTELRTYCEDRGIDMPHMYEAY